MIIKNTPVIVAVSGGFDPVHIGHIRLFKEAKALGDKLIVIINNDHWLRKKKNYTFLSQEERHEIIQAISYVDEAILTDHPEDPLDMSVCKELQAIEPHIFANGGDRFEENIPEVKLCRQLGCHMVFNVGAGGKIQSSSWLVDKLRQQG